MRYAVIENGIVANLVVADAPLVDNWVEAGSANIGDIWDGTAFTAPPLPPVTKEQVNQERNKRVNAGFTWNGKEFQSDSNSRENISGAATSATAYIVNGGSPDEIYWQSPDTPFIWLATDNTSVQMTPVEVIDFGNTALAHKKAHIFAARTLKDMVTIPTDYTADKYWP